MNTLAVFIPDSTAYEEAVYIGSGVCRYIHFCPTRGYIRKKRLYRRLQKQGLGAFTADTFWANALGLPLLCGNGERLILALFDKLLPPSTTRIVAAFGQVWEEAALLRLVRKTPYLELVGPAGLSAAAERLSAETGAAVPLFSSMPATAGKQVVLLPGTAAQADKGALDLRHVSACSFAPPPSLRTVCAHTGSDGDTLEALLTFFDVPIENVGIFCRITQNTTGI